MVDPSSYFRLHGKAGANDRDIELYARGLPVTLGRAPNMKNHLQIDEGDNTISREHVRVSWNREAGAFEITCLSKNGAIVDRGKVLSGFSKLLKNNSAVRIGSSRFYFSYPNAPKLPKPIPVDVSVFSGGSASTAAAAGAVNDSAGKASPGKAKAPPRKRKVSDGGGSTAKKARLGDADGDRSGNGGTFAEEDGAGAAEGWVESAVVRSESGNGVTGGKASGGTRVNYAKLLAVAFLDPLLPRHSQGGHSQKDILDRILATHPELASKQSGAVKRSLIAALSKICVKASDSEADPRWLPKPSGGGGGGGGKDDGADGEDDES